VCECFGVLGWHIGNHVQGDQRLGLCHHLANINHCAGRRHRLAMAEDSAALEKELDQTQTVILVGLFFDTMKSH
jgi:hypothetical protein